MFKWYERVGIILVLLTIPIVAVFAVVLLSYWVLHM